MDYKKLAYEALQRVSVSTTWSEDAIQRVANYLETKLQNTSSNSDYFKCDICGVAKNVAVYYYCDDCIE